MRILIFGFIIALFSNSIVATEYRGQDAKRIISGSVLVRTNNNSDFPDYILFEQSNQFDYSKFSSWVKQYLITPEKINFKLISSTVDKLGYVHYKYQQLYKGTTVDRAVFTLHTKDLKVISFSGNIFDNIVIPESNLISENEAIQIAKNNMKAVSYKWEDASEEKQLKFETGNPAATYYPSPELTIFSYARNVYSKAYSVVLYAKKPIDKKEYFIDAITGKIINVRQRLYFGDVPGTATTKYSGNQTITTDSYNGSYRLRESGRGNGIETYNVLTGTDYGAAVDFIDTDNNWNNVNPQQDEVATDAHWGTEKTYDYFFLNHGRNSIDNSGFKLISYVHYDVDFGNAFWDGQRMTYGDGTNTPFTALDICGHEITHGLDENTAGLIYQNESGALNEGFSDIFGTAIEFYAKPSLANWTMGEDIGFIIRSMSNPNSYNDPDTYNGTNWYSGTADYGGVHTNCTVLSYWFYLVSQGGSGTNDIGNSFSVNGIGLNSAAEIAFRMLTVYLTPNSTFEDARFFAIVSAIDLYGACTPQVETVTNAMYAVGLGSLYVPSVVADFSSPFSSGCSAPFTVNFHNLSSNSSSFSWNFGDGNTSTLVNPTHTYNSLGNYNVTLIADGGTCGRDTTIKNSFVFVNEANPCIVILPYSGTAVNQTACSGKIFDGGGPSGNYADNSDALVTISPNGATTVTLNFISFDIEPGDNGTCNFDYIELFDGPTVSSISLGKFCNLNGSPGIISSTGGSITLLLHSDQGLNLSGFEADWLCSLANTAPTAMFSNSVISTCTGDVNFVDQSTNGPTSWLWDFGDGSTSVLQNPSHTYTSNGVFNVSLTVSNLYGSDSQINTALVTVNIPLSPTSTGDTICNNQSAILNASGSGLLNWYSTASGGSLVFTGSVFNTPILSSSVTYYVENVMVSPSQYVGDTRSNTGGSIFSSANVHYLIFDCFAPCKLVSIEVNASTAGARTIQLRNSLGTILDTRTINIPMGVSRITLNFDLPAENNLQLVGPASPNLWRNDVNCTYPYQILNLVSIKSSSASTNRYYYFYDWEVKEQDCISPRIPVAAIVEDCTGMDESFVSHFQVYPNPIKDFITVNNIGNEIIRSINIFDVVGNKISIKKIKINENSFEIETEFISQGVYILNIETAVGSYSQKIIKE